jgi:hypothetical protein
LRYLTIAVAAVGAWGGEPQQAESKAEEHQRAEQELEQQTKQRILGVIPNFNTSYIQDPAPLTSRQKFRLALRSTVDPFVFVGAGIDAGLEQADNSYPGYGQGAQGYAKRFGASIADNFSGTMIGGAILPSLLHQDPRYLSKGTGSFRGRVFWAIASTFRAKNDNGHWAPNYSNLLGNLAAGALANAYYPSTDRGVELTFERALTVTAEGAIGSVFIEFWPDISRKLFQKKRSAHASGGKPSTP